MTSDGWPRRAWCAIGSGLAFMVVFGLAGLVFAIVAIATRLAVGADVI